jgi:hypothetical protein
MDLIAVKKNRRTMDRADCGVSLRRIAHQLFRGDEYATVSNCVSDMCVTGTPRGQAMLSQDIRAGQGDTSIHEGINS